MYFLCPCSKRLKFPSAIDDCKRNCGLLTLMARVFREQTGIYTAAFLSLACHLIMFWLMWHDHLRGRTFSLNFPVSSGSEKKPHLKSRSSGILYYVEYVSRF